MRDVDADGVPVPALPPGRRAAPGSSSTCTAAASSSTTSTCTTRPPAGSPTAPGCAVLSVDYRRPPEHRFPAAPDDVSTVVALAGRARRRARLAGPAYVHGDSAGGNLALVAALRHPGRFARGRADLPVPRPDAPASTPTARPPTASTRARPPGTGSSTPPRRPTSTHPDLAPLLSDRLGTLPPTLVVTAEHDPLRDEGEHLRRLLAEAGVEVVATRYLGQVHGFWRHHGVFPAAEPLTRQVAGVPAAAPRLTSRALEHVAHARAPRLRPCRPRPQGPPARLAHRPRLRAGRPRPVRLRRRSTTTRSSACAPPRRSPPSGPSGLDSLGVVIGGSGNGEQMAANKVTGVRAALVWSEETAVLAREHNDANVVSVGGRMHSLDDMTRFVEVFLADPVHRRRAARPPDRPARRLRDDRRASRRCRSPPRVRPDDA